MKKPLLLGWAGAVLTVMLISGCPIEVDDQTSEATFGNTLSLSGQVKSADGTDYAPGGEKAVQVLCGEKGVNAATAKVDGSGKLSVVVTVPPDEALKPISVLTNTVAAHYPGAVASAEDAKVVVLSMIVKDTTSGLKKIKSGLTAQTVDYWYTDRDVTITGTHASTGKELKMELKRGWNAICAAFNITNGATELALSNPDGLNWTKMP
jgi:hypothetical protein